MKTLGIALALGDIYRDGGAGEVIKPFDGAVARFDGLIRAIDTMVTLIVSTAGYSKNIPLYPQPERQVSLAKQLERFLREHRKALVPWVTTRPLCWSTRNEVRVGMKLAQQCGFAKKDEKVKVVIASNATHLLRITLYAFFYKPRMWTFRPVIVRHHFSLQSHLLEPVKLLRDVVYVFRVLARVKRIKRS